MPQDPYEELIRSQTAPVNQPRRSKPVSDPYEDLIKQQSAPRVTKQPTIVEALQRETSKVMGQTNQMMKRLPKTQPSDAINLQTGSVPNLQNIVTQARENPDPAAQQNADIRDKVISERYPTTFKGKLARNIGRATSVLNPYQFGYDLFRPNEDIINEETNKRIEAQQRANTPEMIAERTARGSMSPARRAIDDPVTRFGAGSANLFAGISSLAGLAPNRVSEYLTKKGTLWEEGTQLPPLTPEGKEVVRGIPEKVVSSLGDIGLSIAELVAMKKATGLSMARIMAIETSLKTSDLPLSERAPKVVEATAMGRILDGHLGRVGSAALFGVPTGVQTGTEVLKGNMSPLDAVLQTGIQTVVGGVMGGGKPKTVPEGRAAIAAQVEAMRNGERDAVLITPGTPRPMIPPGYRTVKTSEGVFIYDPKAITEREIKAKVVNGTHGEILGNVAPKPEPGEPTGVVVARDAQGNEVQGAAVPPEAVPAQVAELAKQHPDAKIETGGPELAAQVIGERMEEPVHHSKLQPRTDEGKFDGPPVEPSPTTELRDFAYFKAQGLSNVEAATRAVAEAKAAKSPASEATNLAQSAERPTAVNPVQAVEQSAAPASKEPWQVTQREFTGNKPVKSTEGDTGSFSQAGLAASKSAHRAFVEEALGEGKPVPPEVLADYPDLKPNSVESVPEGAQSKKPKGKLDQSPEALVELANVAVSTEKARKESVKLIADQLRKDLTEAPPLTKSEQAEYDQWAKSIASESDSVEIGRDRSQIAAERLVEASKDNRHYRKEGSEYVVYEERPKSEPKSGQQATPRATEMRDTSSEIVSALDYTNNPHYTAKAFATSPLKAQVLAELPKGATLYNPTHPDSPEMQAAAIKLRAPNGSVWEVDLAEGHRGDSSWKQIGSRIDGFAIRNTGEVAEAVPLAASVSDNLGNEAKNAGIPRTESQATSNAVPHSREVINAIGSTGASDAFVVVGNQRMKVRRSNYGTFGRIVGEEIYLDDKAGSTIDAALVNRVEDSHGKVLYEKPSTPKVASPKTLTTEQAPVIKPEQVSPEQSTLGEGVEPSKVTTAAPADSPGFNWHTREENGEWKILNPEGKEVSRVSDRTVAEKIVQEMRDQPEEPVGMSLSQAVRAAGGIKPGQHSAGEYEQLTNKESGSTGIVNNKTGKNEERLAQSLAEDGYGWTDWAHPTGEPEAMGKPVFEIDMGRFREAIAEDVTGSKKHYTVEDVQNADSEAAYRKRLQSEQDEHDANETVSLLENEASGVLYDKIVAGEANQTDIADFKRQASELGISPEHTDKLIASAREGGISDATELPQESGTTQTSGEPQDRPVSSTAAKREKVTSDREARGLDPIPKPERKSDETTLAEAKAANAKDPTEPMRLVDEVLNGNRGALSDTQTVQLDLHVQGLKNKYDAVNKELSIATDPAKIRELSDRSDSYEREIRSAEEAFSASGTEKGRALRAQRIEIDQDFRLLSMVSRAIKARGRELTTAERDTIKAQSEQIAELQKKFEQATERAVRAEAERSVNRIKSDIAKETRRAVRGEKKQSLDTEAAQLRQLIAATWKKTRGGSEGIHSALGLAKLDPEGEVTKLVVQLAKNRLKANVGLKAEALIDEVHGILKDAVDLSRRDVAEMISGYGKTFQMSQDAVDVKLRELKSIIASNLGKADVIEKGMAPARRGLQRDKPTQEMRQAARDLRDALKEHGIKVEQSPRSVEEQQKSKLDAAKTATRNRIEDLTKWIADGKRTVASKAETIPDAELKLLRSERDRLQTVFDSITAEPKPDPEVVRIESALKTTSRSIEDLQKRLRTGDLSSKGTMPAPWSPELGKLKQEQAKLQKELSDARKAARPVVDKARRAVVNALRAVNKSVADLETKIRTGNLATKTPGARPTSPELETARDEQSVLRDILNGLRSAERKANKPAPDSFEVEARKLLSTNKAFQSRVEKQIADYERRIKAGDFSEKAKRPSVVYNKENLALQKQLEQIKQAYENANYRANRGTWGRIKDTAASLGNIPKTMKSMADISAVFRQGGFYAITHPIEGLAKPGANMLRAFTETGYRNVENAIKNDANFGLAKRSGVEFTGVDKSDPNLSHKEEGYLGTNAIDTLAKGKLNPLRVVKGVANFSERTFVSFLDSQRMHIFNKMVDALKPEQRNPQALKDIARLINQGTGRGNLGAKGNQAAPLLNLAMFSPRLVASRVQLLNNMFNPVAMARKSPGVRKQMIADNVKFLAATATVMALAKGAGGTVNTDPDDGDFLKIRLGKTTYDTLTGLQQPLRYIVNMGRAINGDEEYAGKSKGELTTRFARSKASPMAGALVDYVTGQDFEGRKFSAKRAAVDLITPLPFKDFTEAMQKEGLITGFVKATPSLTGVGVQTYDQVPEKPATLAEKLARKFVRDNMPDKTREDEEIDRSKKLADLRARSRKGEDVSNELSTVGATNRQKKSVQDAKSKTRLQEDLNRLGPKEALIVYGAATPAQREEIRKLLEKKTTKAKIDKLSPTQQADIRRRMKLLGVTETEEVPAASPFRPPSRRSPFSPQAMR